MRSRGEGSGRLTSRPLFKAAMAVLSVLCAAPSDCGGGGGGGLPFENYTVPPPNTQALSQPQVQSIVDQAESAATNVGTPAVIAVVDRVGNVLASYDGRASRRLRPTRRHVPRRPARPSPPEPRWAASRVRCVRSHSRRSQRRSPGPISRRAAMHSRRAPRTRSSSRISAVCATVRNGRSALRRAVQPIAVLRFDPIGQRRTRGPHAAPLGPRPIPADCLST